MLFRSDGTCAENRFCLSAKRTSPFKSAGASVQSTTGSRGVRISGSNAGCTMFRGSEKSTGYSLHSPVSPSPPHPCVTVCHHISTGLYMQTVCALCLLLTILYSATSRRKYSAIFFLFTSSSLTSKLRIHTQAFVWTLNI